MIVVFDANIYLSAFISSKGVPSELIRQYWMEARAFDVATSPAILSEIERVLHYPKFKKYAKAGDVEVDVYFASLRALTIATYPDETVSISSDDDDNRYIECAIKSQAKYIVTGDKKHLLPIGEYRGIKIVLPRDFLNLLRLDLM
jgi:putative PIN family toxin of toxin-antitoxin system